MLVAAGALSLAACSEKKKTDDIIAPKPVVKVASGPVKMQGFNHKESVEWGGRKYSVSIQRSVDESSDVFTDETGGKYYDNKISLCIYNPDGTQLLKREFTKHSFDQFVDAAYMSKSTVLGVAVDHVEGNNLMLVASVGCPDQLSDDFIPITITVSKDGSLSMKKGQDIGTSSNPNADEED